MLVSLSITNLVLIDHLTLSFENGLSALTGETGAGKSILLDALGLSLGMRSDAALIRTGTDQAIVASEFLPPLEHPVFTALKNHGIPFTDSLVFRRVLLANGRSRAFVNDQLISVGFLKQLGDQLLEIHGQFDRLLDASLHKSLLDDFANDQTLKKEVQTAYEVWKEKLTIWTLSKERLKTLKEQEDFLRFQLADLTKLDIQNNEEESLLEKRQALSQLSKNSDAVSAAWKFLGGHSVLEALSSAKRALEKASLEPESALSNAFSSLEKAIVEATEALSLLEEVQQSFEDGPEQLVKIDDRLHILRAAARKHGLTISDLPEFLKKLSLDLNSLDQAEDITQSLWLDAQRERQIYCQVATLLSEKRIAAAQSLSAAVTKELPPLKLPQAQFMVEVSVLPEQLWGEGGIDRVDFMVAMNKGQSLCSLTKAASGGELARLMLCLKAILARNSNLTTIIFDEIDIGVGGAVAAAIGEKLHDLAEHVQVLAITHSPQVAARAAHHYEVTKEDTGTQMKTSVFALPPHKREEEVARMLSGEQTTPQARAAARQLLEQSIAKNKN